MVRQPAVFPHRRCTYICEPFPEDVPPIPYFYLLFYHLFVLAIFLKHYSHFLFPGAHFPCLFDDFPSGKPALKPILPMIIYGRSQDYHDGELRKEDAVEYERLRFIPCFQALRDDVGARVDYEGRQAGCGDGRELHIGWEEFCFADVWQREEEETIPQQISTTLPRSAKATERCGRVPSRLRFSGRITR